MSNCDNNVSVWLKFRIETLSARSAQPACSLSVHSSSCSTQWYGVGPTSASGEWIDYTNGGSNANAVGASTWEAITTATGTPLATTAGAMLNMGGGSFSMDGRAAADMVGGTNYQRPEDLELQVLANGDEVLYIATTTTNEVYSLNLATNEMKVFANRNTFNSVTGAAVGSEFTSPDNLAIDANGNIYIIEDQPGGRADIWFAQDADRDGVAESVSRWASLSTVGAEQTGLYFDKFNPNVAYVNVQHPSSGNDTLLQITAVPEPETYAMFLAGLGLMGMMSRRRMRG